MEGKGREGEGRLGRGTKGQGENRHTNPSLLRAPLAVQTCTTQGSAWARWSTGLAGSGPVT